MTKELKGTVQGDGDILYLDCGDGYTFVKIHRTICTPKKNEFHYM